MAISSRRRSGFTLVELLVVITIIGMLVALLLPAINGARERGRQLQCLNNIKQLSTATISHDSSKGSFPGMTQFIKRGQNKWASVDYDSTTRKFVVITAPTTDPTKIAGFSWVTVLLPRLERGDIWDQIVQPSLVGTSTTEIPVQIPPMDTVICPSDRDLTTQPDVSGLSYAANCGAWDLDNVGASAKFLYVTSPDKYGDTVENGVFFDLAEYDRGAAKGIPVRVPRTRMSAIKDGAGTTLLLAENIHKTYESSIPSGAPAFSWLFGVEQQLGFVWVVSTASTAPAPAAEDTIGGQERLNGNKDDRVTFDPNSPRFARPASYHSGGANVAFCDGHGLFLRDDIDYVVYQQLMTPNGRKSLNPANHLDTGTSMTTFHAAPPLNEKDFL